MAGRLDGGKIDLRGIDFNGMKKKDSKDKVPDLAWKMNATVVKWDYTYREFIEAVGVLTAYWKTNEPKLNIKKLFEHGLEVHNNVYEGVINEKQARIRAGRSLNREKSRD